MLVAAVLCVALLGCAQEFPLQQYSAQDGVHRTALQQERDFDSRLALARLYFEHNDLEQADRLLRDLVQEDPNSAEALAWFGANNCKFAARTDDRWLLGLRKLYLTRACLDQVRTAAQRAPDDLTVQLVFVNTGAIADKFGSLDEARGALNRLLAGKRQEGGRYPPGPRAHIFLAAAQVAKASGDAGAAKGYLDRVVALEADPATVATAKERLAGL
jgi:tetratricopeptide (TPR) repeat protein